jgi:hypothetical protein
MGEHLVQPDINRYPWMVMQRVDTLTYRLIGCYDLEGEARDVARDHAHEATLEPIIVVKAICYTVQE